MFNDAPRVSMITRCGERSARAVRSRCISRRTSQQQSWTHGPRPLGNSARFITCSLFCATREPHRSRPRDDVMMSVRSCGRHAAERRSSAHQLSKRCSKVFGECIASAESRSIGPERCWNRGILWAGSVWASARS